MARLSEVARQRIVGWMDAQPKITQTVVARGVGVTQAWVSRYKSGDQDADVDQLDAMARVFGHTLFELFDARPNPREHELIEAFRKLDPANRELAVKMLQALVPPAPRAKGRTRTDER